MKKKYCLIPQGGYKVLVPYRRKMDEFKQISEQMKKDGVTAELLRRAAPITINTFLSKEDLECFAEQMYYPSRNHQHDPSDVFVLLPQCTEIYTDDMGFQIENTKTWSLPFIT